MLKLDDLISFQNNHSYAYQNNLYFSYFQFMAINQEIIIFGVLFCAN